ncbi:MAG: hypothetical protein U0893_01130 [Chloroflexota bacterium]
MRQWISALALLLVVAGMATFAVGSIVTIVNATQVLQRAAGADVDSSLYAESFGDCDSADSASCY